MNQDDITKEIENAYRSNSDASASAGDSGLSGVSDTNQRRQNEEPGRVIEDTARAQGWKPADEFTGDPSEWVSAETFVERGRLLKVIHKKNQESSRQQEELDSMRKAVFDMKDMLNKAQEHALQRAREEVKAEKIAALRAGEMEKVVSLDEELLKLDTREKEYKEKVEQEKKNLEVKTSPDTSSAEDEFSNYYKGWITTNGWYLDNKAMRADADTYGRNYVASNPDATPEDTFKYVNEKIRKEYPDKFQQQDTRRPGDVMQSKMTTGTNKAQTTKVDIRKLSAEQLEVARNFEALNIMSVEDYAKSALQIK